MHSQIDEAMQVGIYPGWDGCDQSGGGQRLKKARREPLPIYNSTTGACERVTARKEAESAIQHHLMRNSTLDFEHFNVCQQSPFDIMHGMPLGMHPHIFKACVYKLVSLIPRSGIEQKPSVPYSTTIDTVFGELLTERVQALDPARAGLLFSDFISSALHTMASEVNGGAAVSGIQAKEQDMLILALPFLLSKISSNFVEKLNAELPRGHALIEDPSRDLQVVYVEFVKFYVLLRRTKMSDELVKKLHSSAVDLQRTVKRMLSRGKACEWNIPKFHMIVHLALNVVLFGSSINTSTQGGEHAHKDFVKFAKSLTNGKKDWHKQLLNVHTCAGAVASMRAAEESDAEGGGNGVRRVRAADSESLGIRYPVWEAARRCTVGRSLILKGGARRGCTKSKVESTRTPERVFNIMCLQPCFLHEGVNPSIKVPDLHAFPRSMALGLRNYYYEEIGIAPAEATGRRTLIGDLHEYLALLCPHSGSTTSGEEVAQAILVFNSLEIKNSGIQGKQTIRAYPFRDKAFHGKNVRNMVMICPPHSKPDKFDVEVSAAEILYAEVILFFKAKVFFPAGSQLLEFAYVKEFPRYGASRTGDVLAAAGCSLLCDRKKQPIYSVIPLAYVLGQAFILPCFDPPCVPTTTRGEFAHAGGSLLFYVNIFAMQWARVKPDPVQK